MIYPDMGSLLTKVDCRYTLVVETAMRARQLMEEAQPLVACDSNKPVTIAINEINQGKIAYISNTPDRNVK